MTDDHTRSIGETINKSEKKKESIPEKAQEIEGEIEYGRFKCAHCKQIVPNEDKFIIHKEGDKKMCQFCTRYGPTRRGLHSTDSCGRVCISTVDTSAWKYFI